MPLDENKDERSQIDLADDEEVESLLPSDPAQIPKDLGIRVRLVKAALVPPLIKVTGLGEVAIGAWTPWKPVNELRGKNSACVTVCFEGCRDFVGEFELAFGGKILKTVSETGVDRYMSMVFPFDLVETGTDPRSAEFLARCISISDQAKSVYKQWNDYFKDKGKIPERYIFETFCHGLGIGWYYAAGQCGLAGDTLARGHSSLTAMRSAAQVMRLVGYNAFVFEKNLQRAELVGMRGQFLNRLTFHVYRPPWYPNPCPFAPAVASNRNGVVADILARAAAFKDAKELAMVWGDEVGVAAKNNHIVGCSDCAAAYREYLKGLGLRPDLFGCKTWEDVKPYEGSTATPATAAAAYYTFRFWTYATARSYEPAAQHLKAAGIRVYPLMGSVPTANGHSMDFFELYRNTPSLDIGWETSSRDPRAWQWDAYMADFTRAIRGGSDRMELVYVKPHRGATIQRLLGIAARGVTRFDWYDDETGRKYPNGQSEKGDRNLRTQGTAARILAAAENVVYEARRVPELAEVCLTTPRTTAVVSDNNRAMFQDAKWIWTALRHDGVTVDILDENMIENGALKGRKVLYLCGIGVRQKTFEVVRDWVMKGGVLWTDIGGLSSNEFRQAIAGAAELTGQTNYAPEIWGADPGYGATRLEPFRGLARDTPYAAPQQASMTLSAAIGGGALQAAIGRVTLNSEGAESLASFADMRVAAIRRPVGKGAVYVVGTYAGLTYSAKVRRDDFNMRTDFDPVARKLITCAALGAGVVRSAVAADPLVETVLVRNDSAHGLYLVNWAYAAATNGYSHLPLQSLRVELAGLSGVKSALSSAGNKVRLEAGGTSTTVVLDRLAEGDIIILK